MKFRSDFVTNSSSSSYCVVIGEEDYAKALEEMHPATAFLGQKMLDQLKTKVQGVDIICLFGTVNSETFWECAPDWG